MDLVFRTILKLPCGGWTRGEAEPPAWVGLGAGNKRVDRTSSEGLQAMGQASYVGEGGVLQMRDGPEDGASEMEPEVWGGGC